MWDRTSSRENVDNVWLGSEQDEVHTRRQLRTVGKDSFDESELGSFLGAPARTEGEKLSSSPGARAHSRSRPRVAPTTPKRLVPAERSLMFCMTSAARASIFSKGRWI